MRYAILCYNDETVTSAWSKEEDDAVMERLEVVQERLRQEGKLGPAIRLLPTTSATTLRKAQNLGCGRSVRRDQGTAARLLHRRR